jgi:hypothetical protein
MDKSLDDTAAPAHHSIGTSARQPQGRARFEFESQLAGSRAAHGTQLRIARAAAEVS